MVKVVACKTKSLRFQFGTLTITITCRVKQELKIGSSKITGRNGITATMEFSSIIKSQPKDTETMIKDTSHSDDSLEEWCLTSMIKEEPSLEIEDYHLEELEPSEDLEPSKQSPPKAYRKYDKTIEGRCNKCDYRTKYRGNDLKSHFKSCHPGIKLDIKYKCTDCDAFFKTLHEITKHSKVVHRTTGRIFGRCKLCKHTYHSRSGTNYHFEKNHPGCELDIEYKCQECDEFLENKERFEEHSIYAHSKHHFKSRCNACGKVFHQMSILRLHFERYHPDCDFHPDYKCEECGEFFITPQACLEHSKLPHSAEPSDIHKKAIVFRAIYKKLMVLRCSLCERVCSARGSLQKHFEKSHPNLELMPEYKCKQCEQCFQNPHNCFEHSKLAHKQDIKLSRDEKPRYKGVNARCNVCKRIFRKKIDLKKHFLKNHQGLELKPDYKCNDCNLFFKTLNISRLHSKVVHEGKNAPVSLPSLDSYKMYRCNICERMYRTLDTLNDHFEEFHPGLEIKTELKCRWCEDVFESLSDLNDHTEAMHPDIDENGESNEELNIDEVFREEEGIPELLWFNEDDKETTDFETNNGDICNIQVSESSGIQSDQVDEIPSLVWFSDYKE